MDVYIKEGRVYGLLKNRKILKLTLDNQIIKINIKNYLTIQRLGAIIKSIQKRTKNQFHKRITDERI